MSAWRRNNNVVYVWREHVVFCPKSRRQALTTPLDERLKPLLAYLVPQFFATKPVERLLGAGITAEDLSDDCLGRALDWLYAHDPTTLFAGIALRARRRFGLSARQVHVDTTSFSVSGAYTPESAPATGEGAGEGDVDAQVV